jgi:hypothetical protein
MAARADAAGRRRGTAPEPCPFGPPGQGTSSRKDHALVNRSFVQTCLVIGLCAAAIGAAARADDATGVTPGPGRQVMIFDRFIGSSGPVCLHQPAAECVDAAWVFADQNGDEGLSVEELQDVRDGLGAWSAWRADDLDPTERSLLTLGFLLADSLGVENLHAVYDADHDGLISRNELLADVRLDERPLGEILLDAEAIDRAAIAVRLGLPPALVERLQP